MKQIPNLFTLLNLVFGCIAIVLILQTNESFYQTINGEERLLLPEQITRAALFIFAAAVVDFLDGFLARLLKAPSEMGKQLDSLSDVVSFGVAPGMILYQMLRMGYARGENGLDISTALLLPAFLYTAAVAWRLAKFNISTNQSSSFRGVPSPAAGLLIASFPLIYWYEYFELHALFINQWFLYAAIVIISYLLVCNRTFMALKFTSYGVKENGLKYALVVLAAVSIILLKWLAVPVIFIAYLIFSMFSKESPVTTQPTSSGTIDITV
jgi:CDP-diacylglycerol--serine O-phosphatidyltransferase